MAKKQKTNLSQAIRDHLKANRSASAKETIEALAAKGIHVKEGLYYAVKTKIRGRKKRRLAVAAIAASSPSNNGHVDALTLVRKVKELAEQAGGMKRLKELVEMLG